MGEAQAATADDPVGNIMQFTVTGSITPFHAELFDSGSPVPLAASFQNIAVDANDDGVADAAENVRYLGLFEGSDEFGRIMPLLGKAEEGTIITDRMSAGDFGPLLFHAGVTETPLLGSTEQWQLFNFTEDSHPLHLHLVQYQVVERRHIDFLDGNEDGIPDDTTGDGLISYGFGSTPDYGTADIWIGDGIPIRPEDTGWQDTALIDPHTMISIVATFDLPGEYVWHCHILSHEDNEMMRPFVVQSPTLETEVRDHPFTSQLIPVATHHDWIV